MGRAQEHMEMRRVTTEIFLVDVATLFMREPAAAPTSDPEYLALLCPGYWMLGEVVNHSIHGGTNYYTHK